MAERYHGHLLFGSLKNDRLGGRLFTDKLGFAGVERGVVGRLSVPARLKSQALNMLVSRVLMTEDIQEN